MQVKDTVLLVDDEPQVLVALEDLLGEEYTLLKAGSAEEALAVIAQRREISVAVTDQRMPSMTGDELLSRLDDSSDTARILVTGFADLSAVIRAVNEGGIFAYVRSEPGQGTRFEIILPESDDAQAFGEEVRAPVSLDGSETILLVEPQDDVRRVAAHVLRRRGYLVLEARNVREALLTCESSRAPIHLLLTDVVMPSVSGRELAQRRRALRPTMRVLVMSGYMEGAIISTNEQAPEHHLQKPFTAEGLSRRVREVLEGSQPYTLH